MGRGEVNPGSCRTARLPEAGKVCNQREEGKRKKKIFFSVKAIYKQRGFKKLFCCFLLCQTSSWVPVSLQSLWTLWADSRGLTLPGWLEKAPLWSEFGYTEPTKTETEEVVIHTCADPSLLGMSVAWISQDVNALPYFRKRDNFQSCAWWLLFSSSPALHPPLGGFQFLLKVDFIFFSLPF